MLSTRRRSAIALLGACAALLVALPQRAPAEVSCPAGPAAIDQIRAAWRDTCAHPLCGEARAARASTGDAPASSRTDCAASAWPQLLARLDAVARGGGIAFLGEVHDNNAHHVLRAALIPPFSGVAFEQFRADQRDALATLKRPLALDEVLAAVQWERSAWSKTADYTPLLRAAVQINGRLYAADPPREAMKRAGKEGLAAIDDAARTRLSLVPLDSAQQRELLREIGDAHCGMIPEAAHPAMAEAQRYRDAHMADVVLTAKSAGSVALIAGNGHVRTDRGAPWYVKRRAPDVPTVTVALVEVEEGRNRLADYAGGGLDAVDFVVFTPKPARSDPCEGLQKR